MINTQYSRQISRLLINGKTINRQIYDKLSGNLQDNGLFDEIAKHYNDTDGYRVLYSNIGYELVLQPHYAYLRDRDASADELSDTAIAIQAILTVLAQTVIQSGYRYGLLVSEHAGVKNCAPAPIKAKKCAKYWKSANAILPKPCGKMPRTCWCGATSPTSTPKAIWF